VSYFRDTDHLYEVLGALFARMRDEEAITEKLLRGDLIIRFIFDSFIPSLTGRPV
jgi:hypothetical protein